MTEDSERPLGEWLRERREELGISLEDAQEATRIRAPYLEALEAEDFDALPNSVVARGFLRNYAAYLELDPQQAVDRCTGNLEPAELDPPPIDEATPFDPASFRPVSLHEVDTGRSRAWLFIGLVVILMALIAVVAWLGYPYILDWASWASYTREPAPTGRVTAVALATATRTRAVAAATTSAPSTVAPTSTDPAQETPTLEPTATPTLELTLTPTLTPSPSPTATEPVYTGIFLELVFTDTSWTQVTADGVRQFQGELTPGTYRSWYGEERVELRIGNAGAVEVTLNGQKLGPLGEPGEVIDRIYEIVDDQIAEATPTPGPTLPPEAQTATAAAPPVPTSTITPTASTTPTTSP